MIEEIKEIVKKLFNEKKIDLFIGYGEGTLPLRTTPCFITKADDVGKLVWNSFCTNNLAVYLPRFFIPQPREEKPKWPVVGVLADACTCRSLIGLLKEKQVPRENMVIVGVPCDGMIDIKKIKNQKLKIKNDKEIVGGQEKGDEIIIVDENKKEIKLKKEEILADVCVSCSCPVPQVYDHLIKGNGKEAVVPYAGVKEFGKLSRQERWDCFEKEISKCIRCYACRTACPNCWCKECFVDQSSPGWAGISNDISDVMFYHIGRIFHQAGRCVDCGACVAACPVNIDLRKFTYKLIEDVKDLYGYEAGLSIEDPPPLTTYKSDDEQEFMTEPEKGL